MKAESEIEFEPSLLLEMEQVPLNQTDSKQVGRTYTVKATVIKDRSNRLMGKSFIEPKFEDILPFISFLNIGGTHFGVKTESSKSLFEEGELTRQQKKQIVLEEIQSLMLEYYPSSSTAEKKKKIQLLKDVFHTGSWTAIENLAYEELRKGHDKMKYILLRSTETPSIKDSEPSQIGEPHVKASKSDKIIPIDTPPIDEEFF